MKFPAIRATSTFPAWTGRRTREVILQHMNRLQNTNTVLLANAEDGEVRRCFDEDKAWVN